MEFSKPASAFLGAERQRDGSRPQFRPFRSRAGATYSALIAWGAEKTLPTRLRSLAYRAFARAVGANLAEAELPLHAYVSLGDFFTRKLRHGARFIDERQDAIVSPCDGVIAAVGTADDGALVQAKGRNYRLEELLASDTMAARFIGGAYMTIYLSPRDYHRVHSPVEARVASYELIPGYLWPVNPRLARRRDALLARNERVIIDLNSERAGHVAVVMVGAAGVGNIRLAPALAPTGWSSATLRRKRERHRVELEGTEHAVEVARADELGAFRLGSTVVLVFQPGKVALDGEVGQVVRFGERIGGTA